MTLFQPTHRSALIAVACALALGASAALASPAGKPSDKAAVQPAPAPVTVYDCPAAGCKYESGRAGACPTHKLKLQKMSVSYICPADDKPVAHGGKCPRCAANAIEHKMAVAKASRKKTPRSAL